MKTKKPAVKNYVSPYIYRTYEDVTVNLTCEPLAIGSRYETKEVKNCRVRYVISRETGEIVQKTICGVFHHAISYIEMEFAFTIEQSAYASNHYLMYFDMFPNGTKLEIDYVDYDTSEDKQHIVHAEDFNFSFSIDDTAKLVYFTE